MALYSITNLSPGTIVLPPPISRRLNRGGNLKISRPAGMTEANFNRQYSALTKMAQTGLISVVTIEDPSVDDNIEVATVSMLGSTTAAGEYRAVANNAARDAIPANERVEGMLVRTNDTGKFWTLGSDLLTWTEVPLSEITGDPNSFVYLDPAGTATVTNPALTAAPVDASGRPQIWDRRVNAGNGAVFRQGQWAADGDPGNTAAEGVIVYGPSVNNILSALEGGYGRVKSNSMGIAQKVPTINAGTLYYPWLVDLSGMKFKNDDPIPLITALVDRITGNAYFGTVGVGGGTKSTIDTQALAARLFHLPDVDGTAVVANDGTGLVIIGAATPSTQIGGSNAGIQYSSTVSNRGSIRVNQFGANAGVPGITGFKSRGAAVGALASVLAGDVLWRATAIGVSANNASLNLAAFISVVALAPTATNVPCQVDIEVTNLAGVRTLSSRLTSEGEYWSLGPIGPGGAAGPRWRTSSGNPNGVVVGSVGDIYSDKTGAPTTTLWIKESGTSTNTGWTAVTSGSGSGLTQPQVLARLSLRM